MTGLATRKVASGPMRSGWLLRDGDRGVRDRDDRLARRSGAPCGARAGCEGGLHVEGARAVHTAGMQFPIDVAFLSRTSS